MGHHANKVHGTSYTLYHLLGISSLGLEHDGANRQSLTFVIIIVQYPGVSRPYLFSDGKNMYNRVVLVCTVYPLAWTDAKFSGTRYYSYVKIVLTLLAI